MKEGRISSLTAMEAESQMNLSCNEMTAYGKWGNRPLIKKFPSPKHLATDISDKEQFL